jgi:asparagine synthase (glutamine-hydrolysing)
MSSTRALAEHRIADLQHWSLPVLLRYEDRNSMAHGIEARVPFVDHELIEHCLRLPPDYFFRKGRSKGVLLEAMRGILPEQVRTRRTKMGFETPQVAWMRGAFGKLVTDRLEASEMLADLIDVPNLVNAVRSPGKNWLRVQGTAFRAASLATWSRVLGVMG